MKMMKKTLPTMMIACLLAGTAVAQEREAWTLDACMRYAVDNSPAVKKQIYTYRTSKAERAEAVASFFPSASAQVGAQYNFGRSVDPETNTYNNTSTFNNSYQLSTSIPLFTGGQLINQWLMAKSNVRMAKNDIQKVKDDLALEVMAAYADVVYYQGTLRLAAEKLEESSRTLYKTRRQEELGLKGRADVAQFEAQVAADDYALTHQQNLYNSALLGLKQKMNFPTDSLLQVDTVLPALTLDPMGEEVMAIFDYASQNNPTALQADYQLKEKRYLYRMQKGAMLPQISFSAGVMTNYFENLKAETAPISFGSQFRNNRGEYISFNLSFPLFNGLSKVTGVRRSRNNLRIAEETRTEVLRQLQIAIEQSVLDREGFAKEAIQMEKKVKSDDLAYRITLRKYEEGLMSSLDVQNSSNTLLTSKADLLQKRLMLMMKSRLVDYYKGKPLYEGL